MKRQIWHTICMVLLIALVLSKGEVALGAGIEPDEGEPPQIEQVQSSNLLLNGSMEDGFYWLYPNHYIANNWTRWWLGDVIPEYDDVRAWRDYKYDGEHAQIYFWIWPQAYTAGIYQQVAAQPCTFYQFNIYGRNHSDPAVNHHARIGIDPLGRIVDNPYVDYFPPEFVWSPEKTYLYTWGLHTLTAESSSDHITAITYVSPDRNYPPYDTFWDGGTLVQVLPPGGRLPEPSSSTSDGFITSVVSNTLPGQLTIEWNTAEPVWTQVWYIVLTPTESATPTVTLTNTIYLPLVSRSGWPNLQTPVDQSGTTHHTATIVDLQEGQIVRFVILARRLIEYSCYTSISDSYIVIAE